MYTIIHSLTRCCSVPSKLEPAWSSPSKPGTHPTMMLVQLQGLSNLRKWTLKHLETYHLVITNIAMENHHAIKNGKPSISMGHLYISIPWQTVSHNQRIDLWYSVAGIQRLLKRSENLHRSIYISHRSTIYQPHHATSSSHPAIQCYDLWLVKSQCAKWLKNDSCDTSQLDGKGQHVLKDHLLEDHLGMRITQQLEIFNYEGYHIPEICGLIMIYIYNMI